MELNLCSVSGKKLQTSIHYLSTGQIDVSPLMTKRVLLKDVPSVLPGLYKQDEFFVKGPD